MLLVSMRDEHTSDDQMVAWDRNSSRSSVLGRLAAAQNSQDFFEDLYQAEGDAEADVMVQRRTR